MAALFSRPLLTNALPSSGAKAMPWTPGVGAIWPTTVFFSVSITTTEVAWDT